MRRILIAAAFALAACSQGAPPVMTAPEEMASGEAMDMSGVSNAPAQEAARAAAAAGGEAEESQQGQSGGDAPGFFMAYSYGLGLELPGQRLAAVMDAHAQSCTAAGPAVCQVINASREGDPDSYISGSIFLRAQPTWLQGFMAQAEASASEAGGEVRSRTTSAEDVTRQMVDTEARLTALRTLRDRLQEILRSRPGRLSDLLEVERELARVQGELDATTSALAVLRQRVDMSELHINYQMADRALTPRTFEPIERAASGFLWMLSSAVGAIISLIAVALPWGLFIALVWWVLHRVAAARGWRWPWGRGRKDAKDADAVPLP